MHNYRPASCQRLYYLGARHQCATTHNIHSTIWQMSTRRRTAEHAARSYINGAKSPSVVVLGRGDDQALLKTGQRHIGEAQPAISGRSHLKRYHHSSPTRRRIGVPGSMDFAPPALKMFRSNEPPRAALYSTTASLASRRPVSEALVPRVHGPELEEDGTLGEEVVWNSVSDEDMLAAIQEIEMEQISKVYAYSRNGLQKPPARYSIDAEPQLTGAQVDEGGKNSEARIHQPLNILSHRGKATKVLDRHNPQTQWQHVRALGTSPRSMSGTVVSADHFEQAHSSDLVSNPVHATASVSKKWPSIIDYSDSQDWQHPRTHPLDASCQGEVINVVNSDMLVNVKIEKSEELEGAIEAEEKLCSEVFEDLDPELEPPAYTIPDDVLQESITSNAFWSYKLYKGPEDKTPTRYYCKTLEQSERVAQLFEDKAILGFDLEWKPSERGGSKRIKENVSMIQLASEARIAILHIALHEGQTPEKLIGPRLRRILESDQVVKAGVNINGDATRLKKWLDVEAKGLFELSHVHRLVKYLQNDVKQINRKAVKMDEQVFEHLLLPLDKDTDVRKSDWSKPLNHKQIEYAASDAYAGLMLYYALDTKRRELNPAPPRPHFAETGLAIRLVYDTLEAEEVDAAAGAQEVADGLAADAAPDLVAAVLNGERSQQNSGKVLKPQLPRQARAWVPGNPVAATQLQLSEAWVNERRELTKDRKGRAFPSHLKAYALWHRHQLSVAAIVKLQQPPLKKPTVAQYILETIFLEKLEFEEARLDELFKMLGSDAVRRRYSSIRRTGAHSDDL